MSEGETHLSSRRAEASRSVANLRSAAAPGASIEERQASPPHRRLDSLLMRPGLLLHPRQLSCAFLQQGRRRSHAWGLLALLALLGCMGACRPSGHVSAPCPAPCCDLFQAPGRRALPVVAAILA